MLNKVSNDRQEVEKSWKLPQLTQDLIEITQKDHLSQSYEIGLYGILLGHSIERIRLNLGWEKSNSVRTHLSRGLYTDIKILLNYDNEAKISGSKIAGLLETDYKKQPLSIVEIDEEYLSPALVNFIQTEQTRQRECDPNRESIAVSLLVKKADEQIENKKFVEAIKTCKEALEKDISFLGMGIKIASCFHELGLYDDTWGICQFLLECNMRDELRSTICTFLGDIQQTKALKRYNRNQVTDALYYFSRSKELDENSVIPVWNTVRTLLLFRNYDISYLQRAKILIPELFRIIELPESNFKDKQSEIIKEAKEIVGLDKSWMKNLEKLER